MLIAVMCLTLSVPLSETAQSCDIHALRGSSFGTNEKCQTPSSHVHPPSVHRSWLTLVVEHIRGESGRLWLSEQDVGTAWSGNPWQLRGGMTERGDDWRWKTPDCRSSSSSSIPQAGWMLHDWGRPSFWSNQCWRQWNSLVDTTSSDPLQYGGERAEVIPPLDEVVAWLEAGMLDPSEGETEEPSHLGRWRQPKEAVEPQAAVEEERIDEYSPRRDAMPTAIP